MAKHGTDPVLRELVRAGFDFVEMSDHYHPWVEAQGHSAFTGNLLPAIAVKTDRIGLATGVTCPSVRYHPAIIAREFARAGFDHLAAMNAGPDPDGFMDFFARELAAPLRALASAAV